MSERIKIEQRFTLEDHHAPRSQRKPVSVTVSSTGTDYIWIEADGYGYPQDGAQVAIEFWQGRLRVMIYDKSSGDPTVIDLEHLRAINLGATTGREQGWDVFDHGGGEWAVEADDDHEPRLDDNAAIRLARAAGVQCDDDGILVGKAVDAV